MKIVRPIKPEEVDDSVRTTEIVKDGRKIIRKEFNHYIRDEDDGETIWGVIPITIEAGGGSPKKGMKLPEITDLKGYNLDAEM